MKFLFAVRDVVSGSFGSLHAEKHEAVAVRNFVTACLEDGSLFRRFPKDYELVCLGEFREDVQEFAEGDGHLPIFGCVPRVIMSAAAAISSVEGQPALVREA